MRPIDRSNTNPIRPTRSHSGKAPQAEGGPQDEVRLSRSRTADGRFRVKRGDTRLKTLRETYGMDFAAGLPGNMPLAVLRAASGLSLSQMLKQPEKAEEAAERVAKEKTLVRLYEDGPGNGGGYPPVAQVDGPGNGGGYLIEPEEQEDGPGNGGGYPPEESQVDGPGNGGGYPPYTSVPPDGVDGPGNGGGYPPYQSVPPKPEKKDKKD